MNRIFTSLLILIMILSLVGCKGSTNSNNDSDKLPPEDMLLSGEITADLMEMGLPTVEESNRLTELTQKIQSGMASNQDWLTEYVKDYEGQTLPYHPNFGVSEEEYNEFQKLSDSVKLYKIADAKIEIKKIGDQQYEISKIEGLDLIDNIVIDFSQNTVSTSYGVCSYDGEINASNDQIATGRWYGYSWKLQSMENESNYKSVQFNIGQLEESKRIMLYYQVKLSDDTQNINDFEVINYSLGSI